jgi:hypothetical protein
MVEKAFDVSSTERLGLSCLWPSERNAESEGAWELPIMRCRSASAGRGWAERSLARLRKVCSESASGVSWSAGLRGVSVRQTAAWRQREPNGGRDFHHMRLRGIRCHLHVRQGPETNYKAEAHLKLP